MTAFVIVNPTKFDSLDDVIAEVQHAAQSEGHRPLEVLATTEDDPGFGQARAAVAAGAEVVCALGGDGTVRAVAQVLAGTGVPLGLLPGGTGNLLARNLGAPIDDLAEAVRVALSGRERTIDVGWLELGNNPGERHLFAVMAGLGFDAEVMADAPERIKNAVGWAAYVVSGAKHLKEEPFRIRVERDGMGGVDGMAGTETDVRTFLVGNCGELTGGMRLLPDAEPDDGVLDVAVLTPNSLLQWAGLAARVMTGREDEGPSIDRSTARELVVEVDPPQPVEVDGDVLEDAASLRITVQPNALVVRVPSVTSHG